MVEKYAQMKRVLDWPELFGCYEESTEHAQSIMRRTRFKRAEGGRLKALLRLQEAKLIRK